MYFSLGRKKISVDASSINTQHDSLLRQFNTLHYFRDFYCTLQFEICLVSCSSVHDFKLFFFAQRLRASITDGGRSRLLVQEHLVLRDARRERLGFGSFNWSLVRARDAEEGQGGEKGDEGFGISASHLGSSQRIRGRLYD